MRRVAQSVCVIALYAAITAPAGLSRPESGKRLSLPPRESTLIGAINAVRRIHFVPKLRVDFRLVRAARSHSRDMLRRHYFAHGDFNRRMYTFRVAGSLFGENLAWTDGTTMSANAVIADWLAKPEHKLNLLDPHFRRVGVGTPLGPFGGSSTATVITADFAG
jgi:uncharacterized protein YkwD